MFNFLEKTKIYLSIILLTGYLFIGVSFLSFSSNVNSMHQHCSYIMGQDTLCSMNIFDFLNKWKSFYLVFPSVYNILYHPIVINIFLLSPIIFIVFKSLIFLKKRIKPPSLYKLLFSDGILNPKTF